MAMSEVVAYVFRADIFCPACIVSQLPRDVLSPAASDMRVEDLLDQVAAYVGIDRYDEHTYDSEEFPKVIFSHMVDSSDNCGACHSEF